MKPRSSFESKILVAFAAAVVVVALLSLTTWKLSDDATEASRRLAHTHEVISSVAQTETATVQIELSTQNFRITGNPSHLAQRDALIATRDALVERIRQLTADSSGQQRRWQQLHEVIEQRKAISMRVEALRKADGIEAANAYVASAPLQETRERTYRLLREMAGEETALLRQRDADQSRTRRLLAAADALVALSFFVLLASTFVLLRRQLRETEASQRALAEREDDLATTLHSIGDAVLATDAEGRVTRMNPVAERLTGWRLDDARGRPVAEVFDIIHEETREPAVIPVRTVLETGEIQALANHTSLIARDGTERPIEDSAAPIRDADGRVRGAVLVFRDVAAARQARRQIHEQNALLERHVRERTEQLRESEDHLRSVIRNVPALIAYVDAQERYVYVNEQYRERFAPGRDLTGCTVREVLGEARYAIAGPLVAKVLEGQPQSYDWQPFPGVWQLINYAPKRDAAGAVTGYYVLGTDITERKTAEEKIRTLNADLARHVDELEHVTRALRTLSAGNRTMLRATDEQELLEGMCRAIVESGGYRTAIVWYRDDDEAKSLRAMAENGYPGGLDALRQLNATWADVPRGQGAAPVAARTGETTLVRDIPNAPSYEPWRAQAHDYASAVACPLRVGGEVIGALGIYDAEPDAFEPDEIVLLTESADDLAFGIATLRVRDEQRRNREAVHRLTHFDSLTELPNEAQFTESLNGALEAARRLGEPFAVLQANIERLGEINDALGFVYGDQMLREFGARLREVVPASATVARLRGDEFAVLLPGAHASDAVGTVRVIEAALACPFAVADIALEVSAKFGVAVFPEHGATPHDLYRHIDIAAQLAKRKAVGHVVFDPAQNPAHSRRLTLVGELRRAIEGGDLLLELQPKVNMRSGAVCGAEGLVRWKHPQRGVVPPSEFIGLAENTGLIKPLTEWVVAAAMRINREWVASGCALPIAVNLSANNLRDEKLLEMIVRLQAEFALPRGLLEMEITESTVMEDAEFALHVLHRLRELGIPLYIDDFGTGYSSLSYLHKLPVEYIKIDQSFVRDIAVRKDSEVIVRSTIDLTHDLGRKAVAEGIETRASWERLIELGCDVGQGLFIAPPMAPEAFQDWVRRYRFPVPA